MPSLGDFGLSTVLTGGATLPLIGPVLGYSGVQETNEANKDIASARNVYESEEAGKARDFSATEAEKLRDWQNQQISRQLGFEERMSSTAVQRRMQDLKASGINPILAGKFDASSPSGAAGAGSQPATAKANSQGYTAQNKMAAALGQTSTALDLAQKFANIKKTTADTANVQQNIDIKGPAGEFAKDSEAVYKGFKQFAFDMAPAIGTAITNSAKTLQDATVKVGKIASQTWDKGKKMTHNPNLSNPFYHNRIETDYSHPGGQ